MHDKNDGGKVRGKRRGGGGGGGGGRAERAALVEKSYTRRDVYSPRPTDMAAARRARPISVGPSGT